MSVEAISAVLNHSKTKGTARSVAICLADHADRDGICWPSVSNLAAGANCSRRSAQYALRAMEEAGELAVVGGREGGRNRTPLYVICLPGLSGDVPEDHPHYKRLKGAGFALEKGAKGADAAPNKRAQDTTERAQDTTERAQSVHKRVQTSAPEPSRTTSNHQEPPSARRPTVNRKPVTDAEYELATQIIEAFNFRAGSKFSTDGHLVPIVGRIREFPELTADDHRGIIAQAFRRPWWKGRPSPRVIYGSRMQFESQIEEWRKPSSGHPGMDQARRFAELAAKAEAEEARVAA